MMYVIKGNYYCNNNEDITSSDVESYCFSDWDDATDYLINTLIPEIISNCITPDEDNYEERKKLLIFDKRNMTFYNNDQNWRCEYSIVPVIEYKKPVTIEPAARKIVCKYTCVDYEEYFETLDEAITTLENDEACCDDAGIAENIHAVYCALIEAKSSEDIESHCWIDDNGNYIFER